MINSFKPKRFFVAQHVVDFRKGHAGLLSESRALGLEPYAGDMIAFVSKDKSKIKIIVGDDTGLTLIHKSFSTGTIKTKIGFIDNSKATEVSYAELLLLLEGSAYKIEKRTKKWLPLSLHTR